MMFFRNILVVVFLFASGVTSDSYDYLVLSQNHEVLDLSNYDLDIDYFDYDQVFYNNENIFMDITSTLYTLSENVIFTLNFHPFIWLPPKIS